MDPLTPFDDDLIEQAAAEAGLDAVTLRERLVDHHDHAATTPGIDELVMEWRRFLPYEPLVERTADAYLLAVESSIWTEFGQQLSLSDTELRAIKSVHDAQARRVVDGSNFDGYDAMVLRR
ncbi:hypothetical protein [Halosegnis longus]|uniref:DUF8048 domain-containing protein n=1 Tax=Halosegnis longus TaxID=2216012 RepID=A0AAJ4R901_9EURY|nr:MULTISPECIES: hypothetical protein [Halobacteriales]RNJ26430.1 hypothetical protein Nmn1133_06950 [Salella cibi]